MGISSPVYDVSFTSEHGRVHARFYRAEGRAPLILDLHAWTADHRGSFGNDIPLAEAAAAQGWHYIRPNLGRNNSINGCCGPRIVARLEAALAYARSKAKISEVHVVGASGGGYTGLCMLMQGTFKADGYSLWVPISDLAAWHRQTRGMSYAADIEACTASENGVLNVDEARRRSPVHMSMPAHIPPVKIYAGIDDGWSGAVPITHSIRMFNRLAMDTGHAGGVVSEAEILHMLELRSASQIVDAKLDTEADIHLHAKAGNVELVVFDGVHEGLTAQVLRDLIAD